MLVHSLEDNAPSKFCWTCIPPKLLNSIFPGQKSFGYIDSFSKTHQVVNSLILYTIFRIVFYVYHLCKTVQHEYVQDTTGISYPHFLDIEKITNPNVISPICAREKHSISLQVPECSCKQWKMKIIEFRGKKNESLSTCVTSRQAPPMNWRLGADVAAQWNLQCTRLRAWSSTCRIELLPTPMKSRIPIASLETLNGEARRRRS